MTPFERYRWLLLHLVKWWTILMLLVGTVIVACILIDWVGRVGWGYPWYSLPIALAMVGIAWLIRRATISGLRHLSQSN
jgi:hypothetical protein